MKVYLYILLLQCDPNAVHVRKYSTRKPKSKPLVPRRLCNILPKKGCIAAERTGASSCTTYQEENKEVNSIESSVVLHVE